MADTQTGEKQSGLIEALFNVGAHLGYSRARRHASMKDMIFGSKGRNDVINITRTAEMMDEALAFVRSLGGSGKTVLFVGGKPEVRDITRTAAEALSMPYVAGRWIGGTITNFGEIQKRIKRLNDLSADRDAGVLAQKYTKKERLLIGREIARLEEHFSGISGLEHLPAALVVVDTRTEAIAVKEANDRGIPVVGILNSDCDLSKVRHPIVGNDASRASVQFFLDKIVEAYRDGQENAPARTGANEEAKEESVAA
ncbi:MAG: 30S ribosomal protein S2 [Candidatus Paceibacteria bacterium]